MRGFVLVLPLLVSVRLFAASAEYSLETAPPLLSFDELAAVSNTDKPAPLLAQKLATLLKTPFLSNQAAQEGVEPHRPVAGGFGPTVRVVSWNIERGINFDLIRLALSDPEGFEREARLRNGSRAGDTVKIEQQLRILRDADILVLNEVDLGMKRTDYRDVARDLAQALRMNYVYGVEFVEVDHLEDLGLEKVDLDNAQLARELQQDFTPDRDRYRGLHGNAVLSRYPIESARIYRLPVCHDWYRTEKAEISKLETAKRFAATKVFLERIQREVRQGGRMALIADVRIPELPTGVATIVDVHLENRCKPSCRARQMDALLSEIKEIGHPVIVAGDLNTTGTDGAPTSLRSELLKRVKDYEFWGRQALKWGTPASLPLAAAGPVNYFKNYLDPTAWHIPVIGTNRESLLFKHVKRFRFADGGRFDFSGDPERNLHGKSGTLANSNQRGVKGFEPTFTLRRDFAGLVGRYKLDWFFVKPLVSGEPKQTGLAFAPVRPRTMRDLNQSVADGISDHAPISVDLPLPEVANLARVR